MGHRILFFTPTASIGGAERNLLVMCRELVDRGHACMVITPPHGPLIEELHQIGVDTVPFSGTELLAGQIFRVIWNGINLWRLVKHFKPTIIHGNSIFGMYLPITLGTMTRLPSIIHWADFDTRPGDIALAKWTYPRNRVIAVSKAIQTTLVGAGLPEPAVRVIHNGTPHPPETTSTRDEIAAEFSIPNDCVWIGITGRIDYWKGHRTVIDAMMDLKDLPVHLVILGGGPGGDLNYEAELKEKIASLGLIDRVTFTGFQSNPQRIVQWIDIVTCPSDNEPFGLVAIEAMMLDRPVIASNVGGFRETILHKKTGYLVPAGSSSHIAQHIRTLAADKDLMRRMGDAGYKHAIGYFGVDRFIDQLELLYDEITRP